jgi:DNA-binding response OmpR family regulator
MPASNPKIILVVGGSENQLGNCLQEVFRFRHALFRYFNWSMRQLQTCQQALAFLRQNPLPLVISWCEMPDGNWKDLLRQLLLLNKPPLLAVSYQPTGRCFWSEVISLGGYDVLVKPFSAPDVFRLVSLAWENWKDRNRSARSRSLSKLSVRGL